MPTIKEKAGKKSCCMNIWTGRTEIREGQRSRNEKEEKRKSGKVKGAGTKKKRKFQGRKGDQPCQMLEMLLKENEE